MEKYTIEVSPEAVSQHLAEKIAKEAFEAMFPWPERSETLKKFVKDKINWSKMTEVVQEQILKMAAEKAFGDRGYR